MGFKCHTLPHSASPPASSAWSHVHHRHTFQPNGKLLCGHDTPDGKRIGACAVGIMLCTAEVSMASKPDQARNKEQGEEIPCLALKPEGDAGLPGFRATLLLSPVLCFAISLLKSPHILAAKPGCAPRRESEFPQLQPLRLLPAWGWSHCTDTETKWSVLFKASNAWRNLPCSEGHARAVFLCHLLCEAGTDFEEVRKSLMAQ